VRALLPLVGRHRRVLFHAAECVLRAADGCELILDGLWIVLEKNIALRLPGEPLALLQQGLSRFLRGLTHSSHLSAVHSGRALRLPTV